MRTERVTIRVSKDALDRVDQMADRLQTTRSSVLRMALTIGLEDFKKKIGI